MLIDIIRTVHKTIRSLFLEPRAASAPRKGEFAKYKAYTQPARDFRSHRFFAKLASMSDGDAQSLAFSQFETLDLHLPALVDGSLEKILITLGGVESRLEAVRMVLLPSSQFAGTRESARAAFRSTRKDDQLRHIMPSFPRLHRLDVNFPSDPDDQRMLGRYLGNILASAKNLVEFEMSGHSPTDLALEAFPRFADPHKLERVISFVSLERVSGVAELGMTEHATGLFLYVPDMTEMDELRSCNEEMRYFGPRTKATKRLTVVTSKRSPFEDYAQAGMRYDTPVHHDPHAADRDVGTRFLGYVKNRSPQLDTILYYYHPLLNHPYFPRTPHEHDFFVPPIRWEAEGHRGMILREYTHADGPTRSFYHVRALSRLYSDGNGRQYIGCQRHWRDNARYRGSIVPMAIIAKVYAESRMDRGWLEPGRDCTLPEAGCKVLTEWFEGLPQGYEDTASESETGVGAGGSNDEWDDDDAQAEFFDEEYGYYDNDDDYLYDDDIHQGW